MTWMEWYNSLEKPSWTPAPCTIGLIRQILYAISNQALIAAVRSLQERETAIGQWALGSTNLPFGPELQEQFPIVSRFVNDDGKAAASELSPDVVANVFQESCSAE